MTLHQWMQEYMQHLANILVELAKWYTYGQAVCDDETYDRMFRELVKLEKRFPMLRPENSPTTRVGAPI